MKSLTIIKSRYHRTLKPDTKYNNIAWKERYNIPYVLLFLETLDPIVNIVQLPHKSQRFAISIRKIK